VGAVEEAVDGPAGRRRIWAAARELVEAAAEQRAFTTGDFNQALMELGATVCVPTGPLCGQCPVSGWCEARRLNRVGEFPVILPRKKAREVTHEVVAIRRGGRWLLVRRGESGLWAGMWQLPTCEESGCDLAAWLKQATGLVCDIGPGALLGSFTHVTTHRRITFRVWIAAVVKGRLRAGAGVWRRLDEVDDLPLSKAQQRVVEMVRAAERSEALVVDER
jgi:A/G-specific adenine glycosylase